MLLGEGANRTPKNLNSASERREVTSMLEVTEKAPVRGPSRLTRSAAGLFWVLVLGACSAEDTGTPSPGGGTGGAPAAGGGGVPAAVGGNKATTGGTPAATTGGTAPSVGGGGQVSGGAPPTATGGTAPTGTGGAGGAPPIGGAPPASGGSAGGSVTGGAGGTGGANHLRDHCIDGYAPLAVDDTMKDGFAEYTKSNQVDTTVQPEVIAWMQSNVWEEAHFQWHNIRRCSGGMVDRSRAGGLDPCKFTDIVPANQEGKGAGDGLEFLAMHRHMIQSLKQLFPKHTEQFEGWDTFPKEKSALPAPWQNEWSAFTGATAQAMAKADDPGAHMSEKGFESEGAFGQWIQTTSGIHGALHFKWVRPQNSEHGLGNQFTNIDNYMFWKMHGWIDKVWDKYRAVSGKTPQDQDIKDAVLKQCRHMDDLAQLVDPSIMPNPTTCTPAPKQTGFFVDKIRPIFESAVNKCTGCHGKDGANANLTLGGSECVKSSDIVAALVNKQTTNGGQFKLIVPGDPDKSWLYRKVMNTATTASCTPTAGVQCNTGLMPQGNTTVTLSTQEQADLRQWIMDGAPAPQ